MKNTLTDRNTYFDAETLAHVNKGGWAINYKTPAARLKFFKKYFCGNLLKAETPTIFN